MKLFLFYMFFACSFLFAQPQIKGDVNFTTVSYSQTNYELSDYNITYDYKVVRNIKKTDKAKSGVALLQIGNRYNKFVDYNQIATDSLLEKFSHLSTFRTNEFNQLLAQSFKSAFKYQIIVDKEQDELTFVDKVYSDSFLYKEKIPTFTWKLDKETKQILGYFVKKAFVKYAGRNWTAWYTEDIPLPYGPYKFSGLPGLILELYDDMEHYHFTANSINQNPKQIYLSQSDKTPITVKKAEFYKAEKDHHENAGARFNGQALDENKKPITNLGAMPYNPIELK